MEYTMSVLMDDCLFSLFYIWHGSSRGEMFKAKQQDGHFVVETNTLLYICIGSCNEGRNIMSYIWYIELMYVK